MGDRVSHIIEISDAPGRIAFAGAERHLFTLAAGQAATGASAEIIGLVGRPGPALEAQADALRREGVAVTLLQPKVTAPEWRRRLGRLTTFVRLVHELRHRRDRIIHTHLELASQVGRVAAVVARCPYIVNTTHNDEPHYARLSWRIRLRALERATRAHIAISARVKHHLVSVVGLSPERIDVIHYGISAKPPAADGAEIRDRLGIPRNAFVVGFTGRLEPQKGVDVLLSALHDVQDVHALIIGSGSQERALQAMAANVGADRVTFTGPRPDAAALLTAMDVFCLPSRWEGLGLVLLEAMVAEVPIIATRAGAIPEILGEGAYGRLVRVDDPQELAEAIRWARDEPDECRSMAQRAHEHTVSHHSIGQMVTRTSAAYERARLAAHVRQAAPRRR